MRLTCSQFAPDTEEENAAKPAVYMPQLNIKHAEELFDDDRSLRQHIIAALEGKQ